RQLLVQRNRCAPDQPPRHVWFPPGGEPARDRVVELRRYEFVPNLCGSTPQTSKQPSYFKEDTNEVSPAPRLVVVKRIEAEEKSVGGIIIPDTAKEKPQQGEVVAVGPGGRDETGKLIPIDVQAGDRVLFGKWSGTEVKIDGDEYLIMKESDIMGVLVEAKGHKKAA